MSLNNSTIPNRPVSSSGKDVIETNKQSPLLNYLASFFNTNTFQYTYKPEIPNGQKIITYVDPYIGPSKVSAYSFYQRNFVFEIPQNYGYLSQIILECTLKSTGSNTTIKDRLGSRIFKNIELQTLRGPNTIQTINENYTNAVLDELPTDQQYIERSLYPNTTWDAGTTITVYVPLFFNFSLSEKTFLCDTEPLQVFATTNDSLQSLGLESDITDFNIRAVMYSFKMSKPNMMVAKTILSTDCYHEKEVLIENGSQSVSLNLECPFPAINMHIVIKNSDQQYIRCNNFTFYSDNKVIASLDRTINYSLLISNNSDSINDGLGTYTYWFGLKPGRSCDQQQIPINFKDLHSKSISINIAQPSDGTYNVYVFFEYLIELFIDDTGLIQRQLLY